MQPGGVQMHIDTCRPLYHQPMALFNGMITNRPQMFQIGGSFYTQIAMGVGVKKLLVYIEPIGEQLLYSCGITLRHVGPHSINIKVVLE